MSSRTLDRSRQSRRGLHPRLVLPALRFVLVVLLAGCSISHREELELGERSFRRVNAALPIVRDADATSYLWDLGRSLTRVAAGTELGWRFYLVNSRSVNAFALPGGYVYVTRGLVERTERMHQFAGVLAHEISHVSRRHAMKRIEAARRKNVLLTLGCLFTGCGAATFIAVETGSAVLLASYSRADEQQADEDAVRLLVRSGISPNGIRETLEKLLEIRAEQPSGLDAWLRTHPSTEDRVARVRARIALLDSALLCGLAVDSYDYQRFRRRVLTLPPPQSRAKASSIM